MYRQSITAVQTKTYDVNFFAAGGRLRNRKTNEVATVRTDACAICSHGLSGWLLNYSEPMVMSSRDAGKCRATAG